MLLYLYGHTIPDIAFAFNFCAIHMVCPKHSHEEALKRIGRYLKLTWDCGLILNRNRDLFKIDSYPDAYFSGIYGHEKTTNPTYVKSRNGYVIKVSDSPVSCKSNLQKYTALSTMEAVCFALAHNFI